MKSCVIAKQSTEIGGPDMRSMHAQAALEKQGWPCMYLAHHEPESMNDIPITIIFLALFFQDCQHGCEACSYLAC